MPRLPRIMTPKGRFLPVITRPGPHSRGEQGVILPPEDVATGGDGIQFHSINVPGGGYGPHNLGDWLNIETTGAMPDAGPLSGTGVSIFSTGDEQGVAIGTKDGNGNVYIGAETGNVFLGGFPDGTFMPALIQIRGDFAELDIFGFGGGINIGQAGGSTETVGFMQCTVDGFGVDSSSGIFLTGTPIQIFAPGASHLQIDDDVTVTLKTGRKVIVKDHSGNSVFEVRDDASVHIKTGTAVVADL